MHDSTVTIANLDQGGITLPDRDYYIKDDAKSVETRQKYQEHVQKMFELAGDKSEVAAAEAKTVLAIETGLAKAAMDRTERRDPKKRDHMMQATEIAAAAPNFELIQYFADNGSPKFTSLNVGNPEFFKTVNEQLNTMSLDDWKTYSALAHSGHLRPNAAEGVCRRRFRIQPQIHGWPKGNRTTLETLCPRDRPQPRHGAGRALC